MAVDILDKITFLNELEQELDKLPRSERDKVMYEYEEYFFDQESEGKNEYQIIGALESPKKIGKELMARNAIVSAEFRPNINTIVRAIMASLGMGILSLIINGIINDNFSFAISNYLFAISYTGLGLLLFVIIAKFAQFVYRVILKYLRWNIKTIKGSAVE